MKNNGKSDGSDRVEQKRVVYYDGARISSDSFGKFSRAQMSELSINDILEMKNIIKYIDAVDNTSVKTSFPANLIKDYTSKGYQCMNSVCDENILNYYEQVEKRYRATFWELFNDTKLYGKISTEVFTQLLTTNEVNVVTLLEYKKILETYDKEIAEYIKSKRMVRAILDAYENAKLQLPRSLGRSDVDTLLMAYINSDNPNLNYITKIQFMMNTSSMVKYQAAKKNREMTAKYFEQNEGFGYSVSVAIDEVRDDIVTSILDGNNEQIIYDKSYLLGTLDYPSILNNFLYIFSFANKHMLLEHVSKKSEKSSIVDMLRSSIKHGYPRTEQFMLKEMLANLQIRAYESFLKDSNIDLLDLAKWFFSSYITEEFGISEIRIKLPS